jgi:hypothetical protein
VRDSNIKHGTRQFDQLSVHGGKHCVDGGRTRSAIWRRRAGSNRCIAVLQTAPLPLGYGASEGDIIVASFSGTQYKTARTTS